MNLFAPDHRTSYTVGQSLASLATGRVSRLNSAIFLLIRPPVCPPRHPCTCSSQPLMYVLAASLPTLALSFSLSTFTDCLSSSPGLPPPSIFFLAFDYRLRPRTRASKSIGISSLPGLQSLSLAHSHIHRFCGVPLTICTDTHIRTNLFCYSFPLHFNHKCCDCT